MIIVRELSVLVFLCILLGGLACGDNPGNSTSFITLERGMCYGYCPVYTLTLFQNGSVIYDGGMYVKEIGIRNGTINTSAYEDLIKRAEEGGFFGMNNEYTSAEITDMPSATITIKWNGIKKQVEHYHGDPTAPEDLYLLEDAIDAAVNVTQWTSPYVPAEIQGVRVF